MNEKYLPELRRPYRLPSFGIHQFGSDCWRYGSAWWWGWTSESIKKTCAALFVCFLFFLFNSVPSVQCTRTKSYKKFPTCLVNCLKWFKMGQKIIAGEILVHSDYSSYFVEADGLNCLEKCGLHNFFIPTLILKLEIL